MTSTESENNRSDRDRHDVAQSSAGESSPLRPQYAKVTLTVTLYERDEAYADLVRQTLPNATERTEVETVQLDPSPADTPGQIDQTDEVPLPSTSRT